MVDKRSREIAVEPNPYAYRGEGALQGEPVIESEVYYSKGGANYFNGSVDPRGYWLRVNPVVIDKRESGIIGKAFSLCGPGLKKLVQPAKSFSAKVLDSLASQAKDPESRVFAELAEVKARVIERVIEAEAKRTVERERALAARVGREREAAGEVPRG